MCVNRNQWAVDLTISTVLKNARTKPIPVDRTNECMNRVPIVSKNNQSNNIIYV